MNWLQLNGRNDRQQLTFWPQIIFSHVCWTTMNYSPINLMLIFFTRGVIADHRMIIRSTKIQMKNGETAQIALQK